MINLLFTLELLFVLQAVVVSKNLKSFYGSDNFTYFCSKDMFFLNSIDHFNKDPSNWIVIFIDEEFSLLENYNQVLKVINKEHAVQIVQLPINNM